MCDKDEVASVTTYNCFPTCPNFNYFLDGSNTCQRCHPSCRFCKSSHDLTDCYKCNETNHFVEDTSKGNTFTSSTDGNRIQCTCTGGTARVSEYLCYPCDVRCTTCRDPLNVNCDSCALGAYKYGKSTCLSSCPSGYLKDDKNKICSYQIPKSNKLSVSTF